MVKRVVSLLLAVFMLCTVSVQAFADAIQPDRKGSITLEVKFEGKEVIGGKFSCIKVAEVVLAEDGYRFKTFKEEKIYEEFPKLEELVLLWTENREFFEEYRTVCENKTGTVKFEGLLPGLYLIVQDSAASGYGKMSTFMVSLPYMEDGEYVYDVTASTKPVLDIKVEEKPKDPIVIPPEKDEKLPQTGQLNWPVPVMAVCGLGLFVFGWYLKFGRKNRRNEE